MKIQRYKHDSQYSYTLGATLTYEMIKCKPETVTRVFLRSTTEITESVVSIIDACRNYAIPVEKNDKAFNILSQKGNCFVIGEFKKFRDKLSDGNHIVLVNPSDAGNMGTIIRTAVGFGINNIAVIAPAVDFFDPRTVRASMGAAFHVKTEYFDSIDNYIDRFRDNNRFAFMLSSSRPLTEIERELKVDRYRIEPYSLIFGNEATGLPDEYSDFCTSVRICHSGDIDSLNLPMAAGIAMYEFTKDIWNKR